MKTKKDNTTSLDNPVSRVYGMAVRKQPGVCACVYKNG